MRGKAFGTIASPVVALGRPGSSGGLRRLIAAYLANATTTAQSLTAPIAGTYRLVLIGPGGSGGAQSGTGAAGGGGSGGVVVSRPFAMAANQTQAVTFGSPGGSVNTSGGTISGLNGSASTATTPDGTVLTAGGGFGGSSTGSGSTAGGGGGAAMGGEFNYPGNPGGAAVSGAGSAVANQGSVDTYSVGGATFKVVTGGNLGSTSGSNGAGGGGNPPTADGLIPPITGAPGIANSGGGATGASSISSPFKFGFGSGGVVTGSGTALTSAGGTGAAFLILEVPL